LRLKRVPAHSVGSYVLAIIQAHVHLRKFPQVLAEDGKGATAEVDIKPKLISQINNCHF